MNGISVIRIASAITLLLACFSPLEAQKAPGLFLNDWQAKVCAIEDGVEMAQTGKQPACIVTVDAGKPVNKVSKYLFGGNLNPYSYLFKKDPSKNDDLKNMSPNVLRWPGGNLSNDYFWFAKTNNDLPKDLPGTKYWLGSNPSTQDATTPDYYETLRKTNSVGCICVNYSYARYGKSPESVQNAAHIAAEWVRHDKGRTPFWEIGNENFGNWQSGYEIAPSLYTDGRPRFISGSIYGEHCKVFIDSMRVAAAEVGTEIFIGIQAWDDYTSWDPIQTAWNDGVFSKVGNKADFVVLHNYFTPYKEDSSIPTIFGSTSKVAHMVEVINAMIVKYSLKPMPIALTEYNIQSRESGQLISFINGMHALMVIGEGMKHGLGMAQRWSTVGYWSAPGEMGTFSFKGEPGVPEGNMRPEFYYYYFMQKSFGDVMVQSASNNSKVVSYASTFSSGQSGIVLMNKGKDEITAKINLDNFKKGGKYHQYVLVGGSDNGDFSANVFVNGFGSEYAKGGPSEGYANIKPFTTKVDGDIVVDIPAYGTVFLVVEGEKRPVFNYAKVEKDASKIELFVSEPLDEPLSSKGFSVQANGTGEIGIVAIQKNSTDPNSVVLTLDREVLATDEITLSYNAGSLTTSDKRELVFFTEKEVLNLLEGSSPVIVKAQTSGDHTVVASFSKKMNENHLSDMELYNQNNESGKVDLVSAVVNPGQMNEVVLQTVQPLRSIDKLIVKYNNTTITSADGGLLEPFSQEVLNLLTPEVPLLDSALLYENGNKLVLYYNQPMGGSSGEAPNFVITSNGRMVGIQSVATSGNKILIYFKDKIRAGDRVLLSFTAGTLKSAQGVLSPDIVGLELENNVVLVVEPQFFLDVKLQGGSSTFELDVLNNGKRIFTDRDYGFVGVPDSLKNAEFIRVPNALKSIPGNVLYSFKVKTSGKLFIAHDDRLEKPAWLSGQFAKTEFTLNLGGATATLYYRDVQANTLIELGANQIAGKETSSCNNYVVVFDSNFRPHTSVNGIHASFDVRVFPNPVSGQFHVESDRLGIDVVRIMKLDGMVVKEFRFDGLFRVDVPVSNLHNGFYLVETLSGNNRTVSKIIINQ